MNILACVVALTFGLLAVASPTRAARLWGWNRLNHLPPSRRISYLRWYRVFGFLLCLGGALLAIDSLMFSKYDSGEPANSVSFPPTTQYK
jgi:hypothetical protein